MDNSILTLPFVPLRGIVVFPKLLSNIDIGRENSLAAVDYAMEHDRLMIVSAQLDEDEENPGFDGIYQVGTLVRIQQLLRLPGGIVRILADGISRVEIRGYSDKENYTEVAAVKIQEVYAESNENEALRRLMLHRFTDWLDNLKGNDELKEKAEAIQDAGTLADFIAAQLPLRLVARQQMLEIYDVSQRMRRVCGLLDTEVDIASLEAKWTSSRKNTISVKKSKRFIKSWGINTIKTRK